MEVCNWADHVFCSPLLLTNTYTLLSCLSAQSTLWTGWAGGLSLFLSSFWLLSFISFVSDQDRELRLLLWQACLSQTKTHSDRNTPTSLFTNSELIQRSKSPMFNVCFTPLSGINGLVPESHTQVFRDLINALLVLWSLFMVCVDNKKNINTRLCYFYWLDSVKNT